jgi:hypothetical protein
MIPFRSSLSDILANAASISVAFTSAMFAGYMIMYGNREKTEEPSAPSAIVIRDPIDRSTVAQRQWADAADRNESLITGSLRDPVDIVPRRSPPAARHGNDALTNSYVLRTVFQGTALIEIKNELSTELWPAIEGSYVPGAGKVVSIEKRDNGWQVVTTERTIGEETH